MTGGPREIGIAVVGTGDMARAHAYGYTAAPLMWSLAARPRLLVLCGRDAVRTERTARALGFADHTTDWRRAVERADVDIVDICTPPGAHAEVIIAAAAAGKAVICEKPLTAALADAVEAVEAARSAGVLHAIGFNYRRLPAIALMQQMIAEGKDRHARGSGAVPGFLTSSGPSIRPSTGVLISRWALRLSLTSAAT